MGERFLTLLGAAGWQKAVWVTILAAPLLVAGVRVATGAPDASQTTLRATSPAEISQLPGRGAMIGTAPVPGNSGVPGTAPVTPAPSTGPVTPPVLNGGTSGSSGSTSSSGTGSKPSGGSTSSPTGGSRTPPVKKVLVRNDGGRALFTLPNARPGSTSTTCVLITYNGSKTVRIRLYGRSSGTGLQQYVTLRVTRGTLPKGTASRSCTGFKADATNYVGKGSGVVYNGVLAGFPTKYTTAYASRQTWKTGAKHAYRFQVQVRDDNAAQGLWTTSGFTWEARAG